MEIVVNNHKVVITFDSELGLFRGEFIGLNGGADFYADSVDGLQEQGALSLQAFLEVSAEQYGIHSDDTHTLSQKTFERLNEWLDDDTPNPKLDALMAKYGGLSV